MGDDIYKKLLEIRASTNFSVKPNPLLKPETQLRYYQVIGMIHLYMMSRYLLGDECGLGKTAQAIVAYSNILLKDPNYKMIVVCPSSALYQWEKEVYKFTNSITCQVVVAGDIKINNQTLKSFDSREYQFKQFETLNKNVLIFNYNTLVSDYYYLCELFKKYKFMIVFDEATAFKNRKSKTWKHAFEVSQKVDRVYGMSGTPIKNHLMEFWSIFRVIIPTLFASELAFKRNYCITEDIQLWKGKGIKGRKIKKIVGYKNLDFFKKVIDPYYIGRKKSDVAKDLPEIIPKEVIVEMLPQQQQLYDDALDGFLDFSKFNFSKLDKEEDIVENTDEDPNIKYIDKLTALIYCQQICNSPYTLGYTDVPSIKENELLRILENELSGKKVVVYTRFKKLIYRLKGLIEENLGIKCLEITGDVDAKQREVNKGLFNDKESGYDVILINLAAKESVNLQESDCGYLVFYDLPFSYGDFLQILGRIHRIGNKNSTVCLLYIMVKDSIDEKTYNILANKKELFDKVLGDSAKGAIRIEKEDNQVNFLFDIMKDLALKRVKKGKI